MQDKRKEKPRGRPLPFKLPQYPEYKGREITFEELTRIRDEVLLGWV